MRVHCPCCHRRETRDGEACVVVMEGGLRAPASHPTLATWRAIRRAWSGEWGDLVGPCPACGQPMFSEGESGWEPWSLTLPDGEDVTVTADGVESATGPRDIDAIDATLHDAWGERLIPRHIRVGQAAFEGGVLSMMLIPFLAWCVAVGSVVIYLLNFSGVPF